STCRAALFCAAQSSYTSKAEDKSEYGSPGGQVGTTADWWKEPVQSQLLIAATDLAEPGRTGSIPPLFTTRRNRQICADPNEQWVQDRIQYLSQI
uniref:Chemokine interleukin-8-like domain-containing protein n=1 Tax=Naja naja TaxID=35670 RepID=A0A8C6VD31_NAJNA